MRPQRLCQLARFCRPRRRQPGVAPRAQVLGGIKRKRRAVAQRTRRHTVPCRAKRLRRILHQQQLAPPGKRRKAVPVRALPIQVHRQHRPHILLRSPGHRRVHGVRAQVKLTGSMSANTGTAPARRMLLAVAKNENGVVTTASPGPIPTAAIASHRASVPLAHPTAARHAIRLLHRPLKLTHLAAQHKPAGTAHLQHGRLNLRPHGIVLPLQIQHGNRRCYRRCICKCAHSSVFLASLLKRRTAAMCVRRNNSAQGEVYQRDSGTPPPLSSRANRYPTIGRACDGMLPISSALRFVCAIATCAGSARSH